MFSDAIKVRIRGRFLSFLRTWFATVPWIHLQEVKTNLTWTVRSTAQTRVAPGVKFFWPGTAVWDSALSPPGYSGYHACFPSVLHTRSWVRIPEEPHTWRPLLGSLLQQICCWCSCFPQWRINMFFQLQSKIFSTMWFHLLLPWPLPGQIFVGMLRTCCDW